MLIITVCMCDSVCICMYSYVDRKEDNKGEKQVSECNSPPRGSILVLYIDYIMYTDLDSEQTSWQCMTVKSNELAETAL